MLFTINCFKCGRSAIIYLYNTSQKQDTELGSLAREGRQGRTAPGGNHEGAAKMGVKFKKMEFLNLLSYVSAYEEPCTCL